MRYQGTHVRMDKIEKTDSIKYKQGRGAMRTLTFADEGRMIQPPQKNFGSFL